MVPSHKHDGEVTKEPGKTKITTFCFLNRQVSLNLIQNPVKERDYFSPSASVGFGENSARASASCSLMAVIGNSAAAGRDKGSSTQHGEKDARVAACPLGLQEQRALNLC